MKKVDFKTNAHLSTWKKNSSIEQEWWYLISALWRTLEWWHCWTES